VRWLKKHLRRIKMDTDSEPTGLRFLAGPLALLTVSGANTAQEPGR
jgi:hypothetical protein